MKKQYNIKQRTFSVEPIKGRNSSLLNYQRSLCEPTWFRRRVNNNQLAGGSNNNISIATDQNFTEEIEKNELINNNQEENGALTQTHLLQHGLDDTSFEYVYPIVKYSRKEDETFFDFFCRLINSGQGKNIIQAFVRHSDESKITPLIPIKMPPPKKYRKNSGFPSSKPVTKSNTKSSKTSKEKYSSSINTHRSNGSFMSIPPTPGSNSPHKQTNPIFNFIEGFPTPYFGAENANIINIPSGKLSQQNSLGSYIANNYQRSTTQPQNVFNSQIVETIDFNKPKKKDLQRFNTHSFTKRKEGSQSRIVVPKLGLINNQVKNIVISGVPKTRQIFTKRTKNYETRTDSPYKWKKRGDQRLIDYSYIKEYIGNRPIYEKILEKGPLGSGQTTRSSQNMMKDRARSSLSVYRYKRGEHTETTSVSKDTGNSMKKRGKSQEFTIREIIPHTKNSLTHNIHPSSSRNPPTSIKSHIAHQASSNPYDHSQLLQDTPQYPSSTRFSDVKSPIRMQALADSSHTEPSVFYKVYKYLNQYNNKSPINRQRPHTSSSFTAHNKSNIYRSFMGEGNKSNQHTKYQEKTQMPRDRYNNYMQLKTRNIQSAKSVRNKYETHVDDAINSSLKIHEKLYKRVMKKRKKMGSTSTSNEMNFSLNQSTGFTNWLMSSCDSNSKSQQYLRNKRSTPDISEPTYKPNFRRQLTKNQMRGKSKKINAEPTIYDLYKNGLERGRNLENSKTDKNRNDYFTPLEHSKDKESKIAKGKSKLLNIKTDFPSFHTIEGYERRGEEMKTKRQISIQDPLDINIIDPEVIEIIRSRGYGKDNNEKYKKRTEEGFDEMTSLLCDTEEDSFEKNSHVDHSSPTHLIQFN